MVVFAKIQPETLPGSLFPSLKRLRILGPWSNDDEAVGITMTHAAPTLTALIVSDPHCNNARPFLNFKTTIIFPALESIQVSFTIYRYRENSVGTLLSWFFEHSTRMLTQIQIEVSSGYGYTLPQIQQPLATWIFLPIDEILSSPRYRALKTLDVVLVDIYSPRPCSLEVPTFLNEILPAVSSRSQTEIKITADSPQPLHSCVHQQTWGRLTGTRQHRTAP
ncbi:hypothetical protein BYT27DRAFT_7336526 [Phlegmacium glaucopus]|nr:hypothetical protein BYT27DRAFT_7336526 [Phlegmacium glaucopus]